MKHYSIINRGYTYYRTHTRRDKDLVNLRKETIQSNEKFDSLTSTKLNIKIEDDWIIEIEEGIRHISEAVGQERQFIATTGEVIPIEKVKRVSKASIVHLAKHSDLITRLPDDGEILTPDKVYMEEKVSDFTVYENRFLFTLLTYLQQFVNMRLDKINETIRTYRGNLTLNKNVVSKQFNYSFELNFKEERFDVLNSLIDKETTLLIERIDMIAREIIVLLACPLMKDVSKAPLVSTPLVKTNILKNNKNFKAAVLLFDYINSCDKDGYVIEEINETLNPFSNEIADDYAEIVGATSFITYKHANKLVDFYKKEIENYELELKNKKANDLAEQINKIKNKLIEREMSIEEYVLMLEKRNSVLEEENDKVFKLNNEITTLKEESFELKQQIDDKDNLIELLNEDKDKLNNEITVLSQNLEEAIELKETQQNEYEEKITNLKQILLEELEEEFENRKLELLEEYKEKETEKTNEYEEMKKELQEEINKKEEEINESLNSMTQELEENKEELKKAQNDKNFATAQLLAMRIKMNIKTKEDDYTSKERFKELEEQYFIFEQFFSEEWKRTKKKIRKQYLSK